jgi:hypothetical protein
MTRYARMSADGQSMASLYYDRMMLLLEPTPFARGLARKKVDVVNYPDGRFVVQFEGTPLPFRGRWCTWPAEG